MPYSFVTRGQQYPAQCFRCIRRENLVDTDVDIPDYGRVYLCSVCFGELADFAGLVTSQQYQEDVQRANLAVQEAQEQAERAAVAPAGYFTRDDVEGAITDAMDLAVRSTLTALDGRPGVAPAAPVAAAEPEREPGSADDAVDDHVDDPGPAEPDAARDAGADDGQPEGEPVEPASGGQVRSIWDLIPDAKYRGARDEGDDVAGSEGPDSGLPAGVLD